MCPLLTCRGVCVGVCVGWAAAAAAPMVAPTAAGGGGGGGGVGGGGVWRRQHVASQNGGKHVATLSNGGPRVLVSRWGV